MAVIPTAEKFGQLIPQAVLMRGVGGPSISLAQGLNDLGQGIKDLYEQDQQLKRLKAGRMTVQHQADVRDLADRVGQELSEGRIPYDQAEQAYRDGLSKLPTLKPEGLNAADAEHFGQTIQALGDGGLRILQPTIMKSRQAAFKNQVDLSMVEIGRQVRPGVSVAALNQQLNAFDDVGRVAYGHEWDAEKRRVAARNYYSQTEQRILQGRNDPAGLRQVIAELEDPDSEPSKHLDADRRTSLLRGAQIERERQESRLEVAQRQREAAAERTVDHFRSSMLIGDIDPLTISQGLDAVKGTPYEAAYRALIPQAEALQQQRRLPFQQRQEAINQIQVGVSGSPSSDPAEAHRLVSTLQGGLDSDLKLAKEDPWQFRRLQTGEEPTALDMSLALQPAGRAQLGGQLQDRITAMRAMQRRYGPEVKFTPFTPAETNALQAVLERADDQSKLDIMSTFAGVARDGREFGEIVTPLAATQPLLKEAANAHRLQLQTSEGRRLGITILQGQRILQDESRKALLPDDTALQRAFSDYVGSALPAGSPDRDSLFNVFRATYAEVARSKGLLNKAAPGKVTINEDAKDIALSMATGGVVSYNGSKVLPPYGMSQEKFTTKVNDALRGLELPANMTGSVTLEPVVNRGGAYYLTRGLHRMAGPDGRPLEVQIK